MWYDSINYATYDHYFYEQLPKPNQIAPPPSSEEITEVPQTPLTTSQSPETIDVDAYYEALEGNNESNSSDLTSRFVGGNSMSVQIFTRRARWLATIYARDANNHDVRQCSGAFIHPQVVITAAHCFGVPPIVASRFTVRFDSRNPESLTAARSLRALRIVTHPNFLCIAGRTAKIQAAYDLALMFLETGRDCDLETCLVSLPLREEADNFWSDHKPYDLQIVSTGETFPSSATVEEKYLATERTTHLYREGCLSKGGWRQKQFSPGFQVCTGKGSLLTCPGE